MSDVKKIVAINLGSTSTKLCYYENDQLKIDAKLEHSPADLAPYATIWDQLDYRKICITDFLTANGIRLENLDAMVTRGGHTRPIVGGTYRINDVMLRESASGKWGTHACDLGLIIARDLTAGTGAEALTVDPPTTDEFEPLAYYSGLPELPRRSSFHALNHRAVGRQYAGDIGKPYESLNLVVVHMGGGITVAAHKRGKMVDANNGIAGDGPFSTNRCCSVPVGALVDMCFSGEYTHAQIKKKLNGLGGMMAYLGENDTRIVEEKALAGDPKSMEVLQAMCYQVAKEIAADATVLYGKVDAILITGGMANSKFLTDLIRERVEFIAPVVLYPGEYEKESLSQGAYEALLGTRPILEMKDSD